MCKYRKKFLLSIIFVGCLSSFIFIIIISLILRINEDHKNNNSIQNRDEIVTTPRSLNYQETNNLNISKIPTSDSYVEFQKEIEKCPIKTYDKNNLNKTVTYYGQVKRNSTSGDTGFFFYDPKLKKRQDSICDWFWAMPSVVFENNSETDITNKWVKFIQENRASDFKIVGTIKDFDCGYYDSNHCIEDVDVKKIEVVGTNKSLNF